MKPPVQAEPPDLKSRHDIRAITHQFQIHGDFVAAEPLGHGHINDTYCATFDQAGTRVRYVLQRINHGVFKDAAGLMENIRRVTAHLGEKSGGDKDRSRRVLTLISSRDGQSFYRDAEGNYWRAFLFIERARAYDAVESPRQAFEAGKAFGRFQMLLADLPAPRLHETIPDFHHTPKRFAALERAAEADPANRAGLAKPEIEFALKRTRITGVLLEAGLPERPTHNDSKFNNVLLDDATGEAICVIDLDTVMPGLALYDFGDLVRAATCPAKEDERDLSTVGLRLPFFEALARGYLTSAGGFLTPAERRQLAFSGKLITFELGLRFLTDFLTGDTYFKIHRQDENLDRCRAQFRMVQSIEQQEERMQALVESIWRDLPLESPRTG